MVYMSHKLWKLVASRQSYCHENHVQLRIKLWKRYKNRTTFIYVTCFIITNQLVLWDPPVNYCSISRWQRSTSNPKHSISRHQLSGTLCLQLRKVPLPSPLSRHIWKLNCSLLHMTRSNISSAASASDSNSRLYRVGQKVSLTISVNQSINLFAK